MPVLQAPEPLLSSSMSRNLMSRAGSSTILRLFTTSVLIFLVHGFHPFREDASIYVAGIERRLDPSLFRQDILFVDGHTRLSFFSTLSAALVAKGHLPLETLLLLLYGATIIAFVAGCQALAARLFATERERWGAVLLAGLCFTLPAAATSLLVMDPYVTARSLTTPISLFAIAFCCDRAWTKSVLLTALVALLHPLMAVYLLSFLLLFALIRSNRRLGALYLSAVGLLLCGLISLHDHAVSVSPEYQEAALSRTYYFLTNWKWYELAGLLLPIFLLGLVAFRSNYESLIGQLSFACALIGGTATMASTLFVHPAQLGLLTRRHVLRAFHTI